MIDCPAMWILRPARLGFRRRSGATATSTAMGLIAIEEARILFRGIARRRKPFLRADRLQPKFVTSASKNRPSALESVQALAKSTRPSKSKLSRSDTVFPSRSSSSLCLVLGMVTRRKRIARLQTGAVAPAAPGRAARAPNPYRPRAARPQRQIISVDGSRLVR
jgi:hypothetical protein